MVWDGGPIPQKWKDARRKLKSYYPNADLFFRDLDVWDHYEIRNGDEVYKFKGSFMDTVNSYLDHRSKNTEGKSREFVYWLQGMFELNPSPSLDAVQTQKIKNHLALVFKHEIDPESGDATVQATFNEIHSSKPKPDIGGTHPLDPNILIRC